MDVKTAIATAKSYVQDVYTEERVTNLGLEEVQYDDLRGQWAITLGFSRPWNSPRTRAQEILEGLGGVSALKRCYKIITVANDGTVVAMKNRATEDVVE